MPAPRDALRNCANAVDASMPPLTECMDYSFVPLLQEHTSFFRGGWAKERATAQLLDSSLRPTEFMKKREGICRKKQEGSG